MPPVAGQEWDRVGYDKSLHPLGMGLREGEANRAPIVHEHAHTLDFDQVKESLDEACVLLDRVLQVSGLAGASEAGQVGRQAARALQKRHPVIGAGGDPMQIERGRGRRATRRRTAPEDGQAFELSSVFGDLRHPARI